MSEPLKKLGVENLLSSLRRASPAVSKESLVSASRGTSPLPKIAVAGPSTSASASAPPNVRSPDANAAQPGREAFQIFLASGVFGPFQPIINDLAEFFEVYKDSVAADHEFVALMENLQLLLDTLDESFASDNPIMADLFRSIDEELNNISQRKNEGAGRRFMQANKDLDKVEACYHLIYKHAHTATLKISGDHHKTLTKHEKVLGKLTERVDELGKAAEDREIFSQGDLAGKELKILKPSLTARYNSSEATNLRRECTPNTRKDVLSHLDTWRRDPTQGNIFWMNGMAGTGKTTIAKTLCAALERERKLGASFFCTRLLPECRRVKHILPTIAYQLARYSSTFQDALFDALKSDPDLLAKDLPTQLEGLILGPSRAVTPSLLADLVIVIDALDECDELAGVEEIIGVFMAHASDLPIKVFVSSRPEDEIRKKIGGTESQVVLHELDKKIVKEDIGIYLREELKRTSVSDDQLIELVKRAGVLFIYAATAARFINEADSPEGQQERLETVLSTSSHENEIDELYRAVLDSASRNPKFRDADKARMGNILHTVVCAQEPLTASALAGILKLAGFGLVLDALRPLWSVLHVSGSEATSLVTTLHASFPDFMFDSRRSNEYQCSATSHHGRLANLCLARIENNGRKFNICGLESSYLPDDQVPDLEARINNAIPSDLSYASQYWAVHLELGGPSADRVQPLENFLKKRLLMWMEVLNLKKRMNTGVLSLEKTRKWCNGGGGSEALKGLIHDAWRFVTTFATNPISRSTPHIYVSMLPFWPSSMLIGNCYIKRARGSTEVSGSGMKRRQLALLGVFAVGSSVCSVAFSPDSTRIICGCWDGTISVWDVQRGKMVLGPLKGHTKAVNSVAFSPDGQRIASGSWDETIRLWDAQSGKMLKPLEGHTDWVTSVAFSPDSARIVSASGDRTLRVWDVQSGQMVLGPLKGHTDSVYSVAFSLNGTHIVSGSKDKTILVWDSQSGQVAMGPLEGHTGPVDSVAFSPNGDQIVSGGDRTIRVWDAQNGKPILEPLKGHTDDVNAVAFSPDGAHIVSGSSDKSIRVWDARRGKLVLGPLEGHTNRVNSVAFSPDGMRIVSGSDDQTIRVWDAQSREVASEPCEGHTESVISVTFTPDGMRTLSGSTDQTVRLWDLQNGKMVLGPLQIPANVRTIAFSPNGKHIVSASDSKIRVAHLSRFDQVGANVRRYATRFVPMAPRPFVAPGDVSSLAFSPDSTRIVSGSGGTIHVWDMKSGKMLLGPLEGDTEYVSSVAFSPDGMKIVSGSWDDTLRMWDAQNGKLLLGPFKGHTGAVGSVAFSPNGMRVGSGSDDMTIRVWDAASGDMVLGPLEGHTSSVWSVEFSPNGMYIVSGSAD